MNPRRRRARPKVAYCLHISLWQSDPLIWRRLHVLEDMKLSQLHQAIQIAMGWNDSHLHEFRTGPWCFVDYLDNPNIDIDPRPHEEYLDSRSRKLNEILIESGSVMTYIYDLGDLWQHDVRMEGVLLPDPEIQYPYCVDGARKGPPDDIGGMYSYQRFIESLADRENEERDRILEWCGGSWNPAEFSADAVNAALVRKFHKGKRKMVGMPSAFRATIQ